MASMKFQKHNFTRAHESFVRTIHLLSRYANDSDLHLPMVASVIKNFELTYETCWKFLRHVLLKKEGIEVNSPRAVFRSCSERGILPADLSSELMDLADVRNQTTHTYDQDLAEQVVADILKHARVFEQILQLVPDS